MPDRRRHRGPHPHDPRLFAPDQLPRLRHALHDYAWLLTHGYAPTSALKLVGDRFALEQRQRLALMRSACSRQQRQLRAARRLDPDQLPGRQLYLDGYNVLTTVEAALAGGLLLLGCDQCTRDLASVHGTWRRVDETIPAAHAIGRFLARHAPAACNWLLDRPVSNSARLKTLLLELAHRENWTWTVELVYSPDAILARTDEIVATSDSAILDRCQKWINLAHAVIAEAAPDAWTLDLSNACEEDHETTP